MPHPDTTCGVKTIIYEDILSLPQMHCYHILLLLQCFSANLITKTGKKRIISAIFNIFDIVPLFFIHIFSTDLPQVINRFFHKNPPKRTKQPRCLGGHFFC